MSRFQLFLETTDPELFRKATSELGTLFYHVIDGDGVKEPFVYEILYFSGSRIARFVGTATDDLLKLCKASGFEVSEICLDENAGTLRVRQKPKEVEK